MKQGFVVVDAKTQVERRIVAVLGDYVAFEAEFNRSVAKFDTECTFTDLCWLAWHAEFKNKVTTLDFLPWCDENDSLLPVPVSENVMPPLESPAPIG